MIKTIITLGLVFLSVRAINFIFFSCKDKMFKKEDWERLREKRYCYVRDLKKNKWLDNLSKNQVEDLLGYEFNDVNSNEWKYYIGSPPGLFRFKRKILYIFFNKEGKVESISNG